MKKDTKTKLDFSHMGKRALSGRRVFFGALSLSMLMGAYWMTQGSISGDSLKTQVVAPEFIEDLTEETILPTDGEMVINPNNGVGGPEATTDTTAANPEMTTEEKESMVKTLLTEEQPVATETPTTETATTDTETVPAMEAKDPTAEEATLRAKQEAVKAALRNTQPVEEKNLRGVAGEEMNMGGGEATLTSVSPATETTVENPPVVPDSGPGVLALIPLAALGGWFLKRK